MKFEIQLFGLHRAHDESYFYGGFTQFNDAEVSVALNEARTARVRISMHDPMVRNIKAFRRTLRFKYYDKLVFNGVITEPVYELSSQSVLLTAADQSVRLRANYARYGDPAERHSTDNGFKGNIPVDYRGMRMLVDCARNFQAQDDRNDPILGVKEGRANSESNERVAIERGTEVWQAMTDLAAHIPGPDFELDPIPGGWPYYSQLNCYDKQGFDKSDVVVFHAGFGKDNLDEFTWTPGGRIVTHVHVLDADGKFRRTSASVAAANRYGTHVYWDATDYKVNDKADLNVLKKKGEAILDAYSTPPDYHTIKPILNSGYVYERDYGIGDYVTSAIRVGHVSQEMVGRVIAVTLQQEEATGLVREEITVVPDVSDQADAPA